LRFSNYIFLSFLFHLLIIGIIGATYSTGQEAPQVFNVNIVGMPAPVLKTSKPVLKKRAPAKRRRRPARKNLLIGKKQEKDPGTEQPAADPPPGTKESVPGPGPFRSTNKGNNEPLTPLDLFDREVIEKYARQAPKPEKGLTFDVSEFRHRGYMRMLKEKIESIWKYPKDAVRQKKSGDLYIKFSIKRDGDLGEVEILRTSGYVSLDNAAVQALKDAEPFWPLPDDWPGDQLEIKGHFIYLFGRTYVM
jgi:protein TonB